MTEKLFYEDVYMKEFDAKVVSVSGNRLVLDKTAFYPRGGGQVGDTGEINGLKVADTEKNDDGIIAHILESETPLKTGDVAHGKIDWERRHNIMKLHSSAHIVFYFMQEVFPGCKNASSGIVDDKKDRMDYIFEGEFDREKLAEVEEKANTFILEGREIVARTIEGDKRCWECGEWKMPCGGTHVKNTEEIGKISVRKGKSPGGGKVRIEVALV